MAASHTPFVLAHGATLAGGRVRAFGHSAGITLAKGELVACERRWTRGCSWRFARGRRALCRDGKRGRAPRARGPRRLRGLGEVGNRGDVVADPGRPGLRQGDRAGRRRAGARLWAALVVLGRDRVPAVPARSALGPGGERDGRAERREEEHVVEVRVPGARRRRF